MATTHGEDSVRAAFRFLGNVKRTDFVPIEGDDRYQKAFVHLDHIIESETNSEIINKVFVNNESIRIYPETFNQRAYWILLMNKNPVTETRLNIHQVVENANILQSVVEAQAEEIKALHQCHADDIQRLQMAMNNLYGMFSSMCCQINKQNESSCV
jgi:hypothetical protein